MTYAAEMSAQQVPVTRACDALALSRSRYYRQQREQQVAAAIPPAAHSEPRRHPRALTETEEAAVWGVLHSERFQDMSPYEIFGTLLDEEGRYLCSVRTMYRLLAKHGETTPRGRQRVRGHYRKPELLATGPNEVWSWDITRLKGPRKWKFYYLYVMLDIFSRYAVITQHFVCEFGLSSQGPLVGKCTIVG